MKNVKIENVGFNPVQKLHANEFLKYRKYTMARNTKQIHKDFPLDPKNMTTRLIFHYIPFNVTIHIYTFPSIHKPQSINLGLEHNSSSLDRIYKIPCKENHHA